MPAFTRFSRTWSARRPCFKRFRATRALPSGVRGPVHFKALARLAASKAGVRTGDLRSDTARLSATSTLLIYNIALMFVKYKLAAASRAAPPLCLCGKAAGLRSEPLPRGEGGRCRRFPQTERAG